MLIGSVFKSVWELFFNLEGLKDGILSQPKVFLVTNKSRFWTKFPLVILAIFAELWEKSHFFKVSANELGIDLALKACFWSILNSKG